jgi:hypothetical protein
MASFDEMAQHRDRDNEMLQFELRRLPKSLHIAVCFSENAITLRGDFQCERARDNIHCEETFRL